MYGAFMLYAEEVNLLYSPMVLNQKKENSASLAAPGGQGVTFEDLLVAVGQTRNRDAFVRLFEYFAPRVKSFLIKRGLTQEMADELAQETLLTVWQKAGSYNPARASASTWIFTIARNKRIDYFRRNGRAEPHADDPLMTPDTGLLPDQEVSQHENEKMLKEALGELPEDQAEMIKKAFLEEKTHADIAAETGIPLGTVKSRIRLALERLRYQLGAGNEGR